jgi:polysaccharide export outer membrane protein
MRHPGWFRVVTGCLLTGAIVAVLCAGAGAQVEAYRLRPRDTVGVSVQNERLLDSLKVGVDPEGNLSIPLIGQLHAAGLTVQELQAEITEKLKDYIKVPVVYVTLVDADLPKVGVYGLGIKQPGVYRIKEGDRVADVISAAGGAVEYADLQGASLMRRGADKPIPLNLDLLFKKGDFSQNLELHDGDYLMLPIDEESRYFVLGFVARPGVYPLLREDVTLFDAIANAQGPIQRGELSRVYIMRGFPDNPQRIDVDLDKLIKRPELATPAVTSIQRGDVVYVPETKEPNWALIASQVSSATNLYYLWRMISNR